MKMTNMIQRYCDQNIKYKQIIMFWWQYREENDKKSNLSKKFAKLLNPFLGPFITSADDHNWINIMVFLYFIVCSWYNWILFVIVIVLSLFGKKRWTNFINIWQQKAPLKWSPFFSLLLLKGKVNILEAEN